MDVQEIHQSVASRTPPSEDLACNPGMCPGWESNWRPFAYQPALNPLSHTSQVPNGKFSILSFPYVYLIFSLSCLIPQVSHSCPLG